MGVMNFLRNRGKVNASTSVGITEEGRQVAESYQSGGANFKILAALHEQSPRSLGSIAEEIHMDVEEVKRRAEMLSRQKYITIASSPAGD